MKPVLFSIEEAERYLLKRISPNETFEDLLRFPRFLEIETIHACNANCTMCTMNEGTRSKLPMSVSLFNRIATEVIDNAHEIRRVSLYKDGEPLLDPKLPERIARLKDGGIKNVAISTNVSLLNEAKAREILEAGLDTIIMSIDSTRKKAYESIRTGLNFEEVRENALRFIKLRKKIRVNTKIWMRMILQEKNQNEWPEYHAFWLKRLSPIDRVYYNVIHNWGGQLKNFRSIADSYQPFLPCVSLWSLMVIFADGDVPLCPVDYNNMYPVGNISKSSISTLWWSKVLTRIREKHINRKKAEISICESCNAWDDPSDLESISKCYTED